MTQITCIADLHGEQPEINEGGDILIIAGDCLANNSVDAMNSFYQWLYNLPFEYKVFIAGNHDRYFLSTFPFFPKNNNIHYLDCCYVTIKGIKIYGSPWTPWFEGVNPHCEAFMLPDFKLHAKWDDMPESIDILVTHGPTYGILDGVIRHDGWKEACGSRSLRDWLTHHSPPKYHIHGHIHGAYGVDEVIRRDDGTMMKSINCSLLDDDYILTNEPVRITY